MNNSLRTSTVINYPKKNKHSKKAVKVPSNIVDRHLYIKVVNRLQRKSTVWPSVDAFNRVTLEYKKVGGRYYNKYTSQSPLKMWYNEPWINNPEEFTKSPAHEHYHKFFIGDKLPQIVEEVTEHNTRILRVHST